MAVDYRISMEEASRIALELYGLCGSIIPLAGEIDYNFKLILDQSIFILKISRTNPDIHYYDFQENLLAHIASVDTTIKLPGIIPDLSGNFKSEWRDVNGNTHIVRMLSWIEGSLWSEIKPIDDTLLYQLGANVGKITKALINFKHTYAERAFDWNLDNAEWTASYLNLFSQEKVAIIKPFITSFADSKKDIAHLRKSVIHNDANDNNIIVLKNQNSFSVSAIIDFGDAVLSSTINDLAVTLAYAIMDKADPLSASIPVIKGYHSSYTLRDEEVIFLYNLVAMRLIISVTKSAINAEKEPENVYLQISDSSAWLLLKKWGQINHKLAYYTFRAAIGLNPHPDEQWFRNHASSIVFSAKTLFPHLDIDALSCPDMSVGSTFLGHRNEFSDNDTLQSKILNWQKDFPNTIPANGYLETRPFYSTNAYKKEGNNGPEYRTVHLGIDFWVPGLTALHAPLDGTVFSIFDNNHDKDYGPTIILSHEAEDKTFYTLYGHLSRSTLMMVRPKDKVSKGQLIGYIGPDTENGNWAPHLHFQVILDMLGNKHDFPGVAFPEDKDVWKSINPDPAYLLGTDMQPIKSQNQTNAILHFRKKHLGKSLSLSYDDPLHIVRGEGVYLLDVYGRKYLDTVNNVAHVGHEHFDVVKAAREQMAVLNTNTRYVHENITEFAENLLSTFPKELCIVHFVNSGSEANELALRMAYTYSAQQDIIALESGYHGNTQSAINVSSYKFNGKGGRGKPENTHLIPLPDTFRGLYKGKDTGHLYANHVIGIIKMLESKNAKPAAFIHESIVSCGGQIELPDKFLKETYRHVRNAGGLCIADEVQTGLGRTGKYWWAFQQHDVIPDIVTIGKPIGNGHPLGAVVCSRKVADAFANGMEYFNTFGGNPVSCAIGNTVINIIKKENLMNNADMVGRSWISQLNMLKEQFPIIGDVRGQGLFLGFELTDLDKNPLPFQTGLLSNRMKSYGILTSTDGPDHNVIKMKPPLCFTSDHVQEFTERLHSILSETQMKI